MDLWAHGGGRVERGKSYVYIGMDGWSGMDGGVLHACILDFFFFFLELINQLVNGRTNEWRYGNMDLIYENRKKTLLFCCLGRWYWFGYHMVW